MYVGPCLGRLNGRQSINQPDKGANIRYMVANKINIKKYADNLFGNEGATPEKVNALIDLCSKRPTVGGLEKIDEILHNYGVESLYPEIDLDYSNAGDTYSTTIYAYNGKYHVGSWGDVYERVVKY